MMPQFDVFLSYSSVDKPWVIKLKNDLVHYGVSVWLDKDEIRPGDLFGKALEQALDVSRAVALIVSPDAINSGWVEEEYYRALSLAKNKQDPAQIIPVILRDAELPGFLQSRNWVDFRDETTYARNVWKLVWGITGKKPDQVLDLPPSSSIPRESQSATILIFRRVALAELICITNIILSILLSREILLSHVPGLRLLQVPLTASLDSIILMAVLCAAAMALPCWFISRRIEEHIDARIAALGGPILLGGIWVFIQVVSLF